MSLESRPSVQVTEKCFKRVPTALTIAIVTAFAVGCGGVSPSISPSTPSPSKAPNVRISITPTAVNLSSGKQQQFSATMMFTSNTAVTWTASTGTITGNGLFTAPGVTSATNVTVTAQGRDSNNIAESQVTVFPAVKLSVASRNLPDGTAGSLYSTKLSAIGGVAPYTWSITAGSLPRGLSLDKSSGLISGAASQAGKFNFTALVTDADSTNASNSVSLAISGSNTQSAADFDGPAELPRLHVQSDLAHTPAPGTLISVFKGGDFQQALDSAKCGDTIELASGAVFTGSFTVPAKSCDDAHWIIVRTGSPDSSLPAEGTRISPCYAGVTSLAGRPAFNCTATANVLAKIQFSGTGSGPLTLQNGANHYRFIGLEITRTAASGVVYNLAVREKDGAADHVIFDRSWLHGTAHDETQRGVMLNGTRYTAVVDSYFSDFHCVSKSGACVDAQAIGGGGGDNPMGPFKIENNFLEAAGENIQIGGGKATITPTDIEIRHNYMFKPMIWMQGQPGYVGGRDGNPFVAKNLFELKNAQRVLFEGNILEHSWGGFTQVGYAIVIGPKNQAIGDDNVCPVCQVTDVTIRNVKISHVGGGLQLGNGQSDNGGVALAGERYSVHDVVVDDIDEEEYAGVGNFAQVSTGNGAPVLQDVSISHVTAFPTGVMLNVGDDLTVNEPMKNFVFTNNISNAGTTPTKTTGGGGAANCAYHSDPLTLLHTCFKPFAFAYNAIIATPSNHPPGEYPEGNYFPPTASAVRFVNYNDGRQGDYHLSQGSPFKGAASDGKDLGADIDAIEAATAGVQ